VGLAVNGIYAYLGYANGGFNIINIADPLNPTGVGYLSTQNTLGVTTSGTYAYLADNVGLRIIDISNPVNPSEIGYFYTASNAWELTVIGDYVYLANGSKGLRIIDISNPFNPVEIGSFNTKGYAFDVAVSGNYAYVADDNAGLRIIDITNPSNPIECGYLDTGGSARGVSVDGINSYVADGSDGLYIIRNDLLVGLENNSVSNNQDFSLDQNFPNPFNPKTTINYSLQKRCNVKIVVFDLTGRELKTLVNKIQNAGKYSVSFNASELASGIYIYRLKSGPFVQNRKMILVR